MNDIQKISRNTKDAPIDAASSQSMAFSHYNNLSAQLPIDPKTDQLIGSTIKEQARQCLENIRTIVESVGHVMDDVVKITVFLKDISDTNAVDDVYKTFFKRDLPARTTVAVAELPINGALLQIDAVVSNGEGTTPQKPLDLVKISRNTNDAPNNPMASQTVAFSHYNNISGQLPIDPKTERLIRGGIKSQTEQCLKNIQTILESIHHPLEDVVKATVYLKDLSDSDSVDKIFATYFPTYIPAVTIVNVSALPMDVLVQVDAVVSHGDGTPPQLPEDTRFLVKETNNTEKAPKLSSTQTVAYSHYNHLSGQLPLDPQTNKVVDGGIKEQTRQCLKNIQTILESIDHKMDDVVKITVQLTNIKNIDFVDEVYKSNFKNVFPARTVIGVNAIPMDALIQIDAVVSNCEGTPA